MTTVHGYRSVDASQRVSSAGLALLLILLLALLLLIRSNTPPQRSIVPELRSFDVAPSPPAPPPPPPPPPAAIERAGGSPSAEARPSAASPTPGPAPRPQLAPPPIDAPARVAAPEVSPLLTATPSLPPASTGGGTSALAEGGGAGATGHGVGTGSGAATGSGRGDDPSAAISANWVRMADWDEVHEYHPSRALAARKSGRVQLRCQVTLSRKLINCFVAEEMPADWGFGKAALRLARTLRVFPREVNNVPIDRGWVKFTVRFDVTRPRAPVF